MHTAIGSGEFGVSLTDNGSSVFTASALPYIGKAVITALEHAEEKKNQYVFISSFNVIQRDILDVFEKVQRQKWTVKHLTSEEVIATGQKKLTEGDYMGVIDLTRGESFSK